MISTIWEQCFKSNRNYTALKKLPEEILTKTIHITDNHNIIHIYVQFLIFKEAESTL